jgi:precorrin-3B methylase
VNAVQIGKAGKALAMVTSGKAGRYHALPYSYQTHESEGTVTVTVTVTVTKKKLGDQSRYG